MFFMHLFHKLSISYNKFNRINQDELIKCVFDDREIEANVVSAIRYILRGTRNVNFYLNLSYFGIYLKYNKLVCLIIKVCFSPFLNSISSNIIELRHFSVYHQIAGTLSIQDLSF